MLLFINAFNDMWSIGLAVFGLHILLLGYLVYQSGYIPKILGILLLLAFIGYLLTNVANLLLPDYENYKAALEWVFLIPMVAGEVGLAVWLLVKGIKLKQA